MLTGALVSTLESTYGCTLVGDSTTVEAGEAVEYTCTYDHPAKIAVTDLAGDWEYRISSSHAEGTFVTTTGSNNQYDPGNTNLTSIFLRPIDDQAAQQGFITITVAPQGNGAKWVSYSAVLIAEFEGEQEVEPCMPTVSVSAFAFAPSTFTDGKYPTVSGYTTLTIGAAGTDCSVLTDGWSIQTSASAMSETDGGTGTLPAGIISFTGTASGDPPSGLTVGPPAGPLPETVPGGSTTQIATGNSQVDIGATWDAAFQLDPPDTALPGEYEGTIFITTVNGQ